MSESAMMVPRSTSGIKVTRMQSRLLAVAVTLAIGAVATSAADEPTNEIVVHQVGKKVTDFSSDDDFSSPEAAYATINRQVAAGSGDWVTVSCRRLRRSVPSASFPMETPTAEVGRIYREAEILETRIYRDSYAQVAARLERADRPNRPIDIRTFEFDDGRWLNAGNGDASTLDDAAKEFARLVRRRQELATIQTAQPVANPDAVLSKHLSFLRDHGQPPKEYVLQALSQHKLVAIGEIHHRPTYWHLNSEVVRDSRFAQTVGTVYLELPMHAQPLVEEFLAAKRLDTAPVIAMLRDNLWMGWPDQAMLDFFITIWQTNQNLDAGQRIRIVLVDMKRPWRELIREGHPGKYNTDRNKLMSDNILADLQNHAGQRHALFIVGFAHLENVRVAGAARPVANAGYYLREHLGSAIASVVQHGPVISNMGEVSGRTCLGLFDEAFTANANSPVAFYLKESPFGRHRYDLDGDLYDSVVSRFDEAFDGYIYLGRLEDESFSSLIPGFYTNDFVHQLDQRHRLEFGVGLQKGLGLASIDRHSFEQWMMQSWGGPREWRYHLGPKTVWRYGDQGDKYVFWCERPEPATVDASPYSREGIIRLVDDCFEHSWRDITARKSMEWGPLGIDKDNNASISYRFEATIWGGEKKVLTWVFTFAPNGGLLSLKDETNHH